MVSYKIHTRTINKYKRELHEIFKDVPENKIEIVKMQLESIAYMLAERDYLEEELKKKGPVSLMENGSQRMYIENPYSKVYDRNAKKIFRQLQNLKDDLPDKASGATDELAEFMKKQKLRAIK